MKELEGFIYAYESTHGGNSVTADIRNSQAYTIDRRIEIVFIGDSMTENFETNLYFYEYGCILNRGIGGETTEQIARRLEADALQFKPQLVVLQGGKNDLDSLVTAYAAGRDAFAAACEAIPKRVVRNFELMIATCRTAGQKTAVIGIPPQSKPIYYHEMNKAIARTNELLRCLCEQNGVPFADWHSFMVKDDGLTLRDNLSWDGIHCLFAGYKILVKVLQPILDATLSKTFCLAKDKNKESAT